MARSKVISEKSNASGYTTTILTTFEPVSSTSIAVTQCAFLAYCSDFRFRIWNAAVKPVCCVARNSVAVNMDM